MLAVARRPSHTASVATDAAAEQTALPAAALEHLAFPVLVVDAAGRITVWNAAAARVFGWTAEEALGRTTYDFMVAPGDRDQAEELTARVLGGDIWEGTFPVLRKDGGTVLVRADASPLPDSSGRPAGMIVVARDLLAVRDRQQRHEVRLHLLARAGTLLAASLDLEATLDRLAELLVPALADHCFVDLLEEGLEEGVVRRVALRHAPGTAPSAGAPLFVAAGQRVDYSPAHPSRQALESGRGVLIQRVDLDRIEEMITTPEAAAYARSVGLRSVMSVPLRARGTVHGVLALLLSGDSRHYETDDLTLAEELATRVATAVGTALAYRRERDVARTLQRELLPGQLPDVDGLHVTSRYLPSPLAPVGGDWFDVIPLSAGRVGIVIGDVEGRGPHAAALMGQLRAAVRAFAVLDLPPATMMGHLDELVRSLGERIVSCLYAVYDAWSRGLWLAGAGHPPPLLISAGTCVPLPVPGNVPLGVGGVPFEEYTATLASDAALLLYTDGLTAYRDAPEDAVTALCSRVARAGARADASVDTLADAALAVAGDEAGDDSAVLVLGVETTDLPVTQTSLPKSPQAAGDARQRTLETLRSWGLLEQADVACLLVSEVVTNAIRHSGGSVATAEATAATASAAAWSSRGGGPTNGAGTRPSGGVTLRLRRGRRAVWVEVFDPDPRLPTLRRADDTDEGGRGLFLVDVLAARWGARTTLRGKAVWFELTL